MQGCIIVDIDSTLADGSHRQHLVPYNMPDYENFSEEEKNDLWKVFFDEARHDKVYNEIKNMCNLYWHHTAYKIVVLTARKQRSCKSTLEWLRVNGISFNFLRMMPDDYTGKTADWKVDIIKNINKLYGPIHFILEDQLEIVRSIRDAGYVCFHVRDSPVDNYVNKSATTKLEK